MKEGIAIQKRAGAGADYPDAIAHRRDRTVLYVVWEISVPNLGAFEAAAPQLMGDKDWQANYQKLGALVDSGYREIFSVVE